MKLLRYVVFVCLLLGLTAHGRETFFIPKDRVDVITPFICVPSKADPTQIITVNHDTTALSVRVTTSDINETFAFSGATIDDHSTRGTHCNPATANVCLETETDGCFALHFHDEVLDGAVKYWIILIDDGQSVLMDTWVYMMTELMEPADVRSEVSDELASFGGGVATDANVDANEDKIDILDTNVDQVEVAVITNAVGADIAADIATGQSDLDSLTDGGVLIATTIATLFTQVSFTLTAGSTDDNAYNRKIAVIVDASTATQIAVGKVLDYTGSTKTITLSFDPGLFTMAVTDNIVILSSEF